MAHAKRGVARVDLNISTGEVVRKRARHRAVDPEAFGPIPKKRKRIKSRG